MSTWIILCGTMFLLQEICRGSVDLNMAELQHVADHLNKRECRRLMAALRSPSRDLPSVSQLELVERQIPQADRCIDLLLRWNSGSGQYGARGRSGVEPLSRRLRQLGHPHLAVWLSKSVFRALAQDLEDDVSALNNDGSTAAMAAAQASPNKIRHLRPEPLEEVSDEVQWMPLDTILCAAVVALAVTALMLLAFSTWRYCCVFSGADSQKYSVLEDTEEESANANVWNPTAEEAHHPMTPHRTGTSHPMYRYKVLQDAEEESVDGNEWSPIAEEAHHPRTSHRPGASSPVRYNAVQDTEEESEEANVWNPTAGDVHHLKTPHRSGTTRPMYYVQKETKGESTDVSVSDPTAEEQVQHTAGRRGRIGKRECVKSRCRRRTSST